MTDFNAAAMRDLSYEVNHAARPDADAMDALHPDGEWVTSAALTPEDIEAARAAPDARFYVNDDGLGWAWYPDARSIPESVRAGIRAHLRTQPPVPWRERVRPA